MSRSDDAGAAPRLERGKGLEIARTCTYFNVRKATRILGDVFDEALRKHGLKGTQFSLMVAVSLAEEPTVSRLAEILAADRTTLTRTLRPLERDGLLESRAGSDRRKRRVRLTPKGAGVLSAAVADWEAAQRAIHEELGAGPWEGLMKGLYAVHEIDRNAFEVGGGAEMEESGDPSIEERAPEDGEFPPGLSRPARRALLGAGYGHLDQLDGVSEKELASLHGIGPKALKQLREALSERGFSLAEDV